MTASPATRPALLVRLRGDISIYVPPLLGVTTTYILLEQEAWFEDEVNFVRHCLRPGESAIDVGANFGVYTTAMAEAVGPAGKIFAFEPAAETMDFLKATTQFKHGAQVETIQAAVSDHVGTAQFNHGSSPELGALAQPVSGSGSTETVRLTTLDEHLLRSTGTRIALIKLDAEGHEVQIGKGARRVLLRDEPLVLFEIKHDKTFEFGFLDFLESLGWSGYRLAPGMNLLVPFEKGGRIDAYQLNIFGCSPKKAEELRERGLLANGSISGELSPIRTAAHQGLFAANGISLDSDNLYGEALAHYASAQEVNLDSNLRFAHLEKALQYADRAYIERSSLGRRLTLMRIASDVGYRTAAVGLLDQALPLLTKANLAEFDEPCLPPAKAYAPSGLEASNEFLRIAVLETFERLRHFSSRFLGEKALPLLGEICQLPLSSAEMHRRRQLVRMKLGMQKGPQPEPKLAIETPGNLNSPFWLGQSG